MSLPRISLAVWLVGGGLALAAAGTGGALLRAGGAAALRGLVVGRSAETLALLGLGCAGWLMLFAGLALYVFAPAVYPPAAPQTYASYRTMLAALAVAAIPANLVGLAYAALVARARVSAVPPADVLAVAVAALELCLVGVLYVRVVRPGALSWRQMGLSRDRLGARVAQGVATGLAVVAVTVVAEVGLRLVGIEQTQGGLYRGLRAAPPGELLALVAAGTVLAPIAEEAFFRGYLFTACRLVKGPWPAYLFSSGLFGLVHVNLPALGPIFAVGLVFALVRARTGSIVPTVVAHALNNGLAFAALYVATGPPG